MDSTTIPYTDQWYDLLKSASNLSGRDLMHLDAYFGDFIGEQTKKLIDARDGKLIMLHHMGIQFFMNLLLALQHK
ncbi:MAG: hypothetical protein IPP15_13230 [Saprospiraceae bacterium]|uniref:Uncharacterized protein n=1 Tax=Candidatus Opimibacter skivensis TaxID=2982028 RepID=A0A9D7XPM9_9BACT|nr:hypothetical protein [Candidatus Opimibacter skivensis]